MTPERAAMKAWTATTKHHRQTRKQETMTAYQSTEADRLTGARLRSLRRRRGETIVEMIERSGVQLKQSSISKVELGERPLTEIEATALAAHYGIAVSELLKPYGDPLPADDTKPALFAVPTPKAETPNYPRTITIDRDAPMHPDEYRRQVWVPYLEARYAADHPETKAG